MVNISIDVTDLGGEARPGDKVVLWKPAAAGSSTHAGRVISTAPVDVFLTNGKATVPDVEPGSMRVLLQCRGVESQGPIDVTVPDGNGTVTLRSLIESQFEYAPPIVSAVQEAASNASASEEAAIRAQVRSEAAADRADAKVDDAINNGANLVRGEVKQDADRAVSARQAAVQSEANAKTSETNAATSESNAKTSESAAKQSETNAGDFAAVATTAATEAVDAMESASDAADSIAGSVSAAAGHADRAEQYESGAAAYAQNASDAADRVGTADQIEGWVQQAQDAADRIGTAEQVEGWVDDARNSASSASLSESKAREHRDAAASAANATVDSVRSDLRGIADEASSYATDSSRSAARAKTSETNAKTSETNSKTYEAGALSAAERAEFAAEETIQQVEGDFATRNYVDAAKYFRGFAGLSDSLQTMQEGVYYVGSGAVATALGLPRVAFGWLTIHAPVGSASARRATFELVSTSARHTETWSLASGNNGSFAAAKWVRLEDSYSGAVSSSDDYRSLAPGKYGALGNGSPAAIGIPSGRAGSLDIVTTDGNFKAAKYVTNHPGGADKSYEYSTETAANHNWHGNWYVTNRHKLRSSPIVLTQPSGDYTVSNKADYRPSHRIAFTCPANVERIRVHVSAKHYRLGQSYGGMTLRGMSIGTQTGNTGGMSAQQTIDSAAGVVIPEDGTEWVSEWTTVYLSPGSTYLLSYSADWTTAPGTMQLLASTSWASSNPDAWSTTGSSSGWGRYSLQPLDIWIECLAPSDVPVYSYFGTSLTMGMSSPDPVFMSYPQIHARNNGAFCAQTAAGGWAVVDDTAQDPNVIGRLGDAGVSQKVFALWGGSNDVNARGATVEEVAAAIEAWSNVAKASLKGAIYLQTSAGGQRYTGPDDPEWLNLEAMNDWIRNEGWQLPHVSGVLDMHNLMTASGEWWKQTGDFTASPTDGHFNTAGNKKYAMALDAGFAPERETGKGALAAYMKGKGL